MPFLGNKWPVGILFLLHIAVAEYSVGAITLAAFLELYGVVRKDARAFRYADAASKSYYLVFSLGATLAVFAVVVMTGLWGNLTGTLFNEFIWVVFAAFGLFFLITPLLPFHNASKKSMRRGRHVILTFILALLQSLFVVLIVTLDATLMTPPSGSSVLGDSYVPLMVHRLIGNVSWTALFLAAFAAWRGSRSTDELERAFQRWAMRINLRIGLYAALLMPVSGFFLVLVLQNSQPEYFGNLTSGYVGWLMVLQEGLVGAVLVSGNIALALEKDSRAPRPVALGACIIVFAGMVVALMPAAVIPSAILALRYSGLAVALLATLIHLVVRRGTNILPRPFPLPFTGRTAMVAAGLCAFSVSMLMGVIKESARGSYAIQGELTQQQGQQHFEPPPGTYP